MNGLLQISDPHFGTEQAGAVQALVRLVAQRRPAAVLLSGDITQRATAAQFAAARAFVQQLASVPVLAIPGNHDIPLFALFTRLLRPYARFEAALGPVQDLRFGNGDWFVLGLNTTRAWRHKNGEVSARQVEQTAALLRDAPPAAVKVVMTHQPVAVTQASDIPNLLRGREA
ncbi:MAG: metallophosphoesterase, partial [Chitinophagaceae bacterium]|nr:metallophosphoesterase [Rubrivivax sp.]